MARTKDDYICVLKTRGARINWSTTISKLKTEVGHMTAIELNAINDMHATWEASRYVNMTVPKLVAELTTRGQKCSIGWSKGRLLNALIAHDRNLDVLANHDHECELKIDFDLDECDLFDDIDFDTDSDTFSYASCVTMIEADYVSELAALRAENRELREDNKNIMKLLLEQQEQIKKLFEARV